MNVHVASCIFVVFSPLSNPFKSQLVYMADTQKILILKLRCIVVQFTSSWPESISSMRCKITLSDSNICQSYYA